MKNIILLILVFVCTLGAFAQENKVDMVILNDGSVIKGKILVYKKEENVQIKTVGGSMLEFSPEEVEMVRFNVDPNSEISHREKIAEEEEKEIREKHIVTSGVYNTIRLGGFPTIISQYSEANFGRTFTYTLGYRFNSKVGLGVGYGGSFDSFFFDGNNFMNYFLEVRGNFQEKSFTPIYQARIGYGTDDFYPFDGFGDSSVGGIMFNPAIGVQLPSRRRTHFEAGLSYWLQGSKFSYYNPAANAWEMNRGFLHNIGIFVGVTL